MPDGMRVECRHCAHLLMEGENVGLSGEDRERIQPCENCGQRGLKIAVQATAKIAHQVHVGMKAKRPGRKKPIYDAKMGDSQSTATGQWNQVEQIIDRTNTTHDESWYTKRVVTKDGEVLRDVSEPLKDHTGRGDAKPKMQE